MSSNASRRGLFIVLEGMDCSGKTTQAKRLAETLNKVGKPCESIRFPDRSTNVGCLIDSYLRRQIELDDHTIHLLFTANRWEKKNEICQWLDEGKCVVCDRYSASGIAYSASKLGLDFDWCYAPEKGLPAPDIILKLNLTTEEISKRSGFGNERYEEDSFQKQVAEVYSKIQKLESNRWIDINASGTEDDVQKEIWKIIISRLNDIEQ